LRIAIISDIHGNFEAFKKVLNDIDQYSVNLIVNLGDSIGYGPDPEMVLSAIEKRGIKSILGNHEQAVLDKTYRAYFNHGAKKSIEKTINFLTSASLSYIKYFPKVRTINGALFVHGCPPDSNTINLNYLTYVEMRSAFESFSNQLCFVGHTHMFKLLSYDGKSIDSYPLTPGHKNLPPGYRYIINVGSVGQPRDADKRAGYAIWDTAQNCLEIRRITYDIQSTVNKIIERGFEKKDADRLF
jgi:predicted phosphodiesterase